MFSFHKPKIYRSVNGCCICKAKSSSSRFTDSKKYEPEFELCFKIAEKRSGEICNACVLLVKRWKKLPPGTNRDWHHVVDARAGPGTKSMMKYKSKIKLSKRLSKINKIKRHRKQKLDCPEGLSDDITVGEECLSDDQSSTGLSLLSSVSPSPTPSDASDDEHINNLLLKPRVPKRKRSASDEISSFLDMTFWKKEKICCGIIFKGQNGEVLLDFRLMKPCQYHKKPCGDSSGEVPSVPVPTNPMGAPPAAVLHKSQTPAAAAAAVVAAAGAFQVTTKVAGIIVPAHTPSTISADDEAFLESLSLLDSAEREDSTYAH